MAPHVQEPSTVVPLNRPLYSNLIAASKNEKGCGTKKRQSTLQQSQTVNEATGAGLSDKARLSVYTH